MKILQLLHHFLPNYMTGSEIYTYHLCRELLKRHEVHLFFSEHRPGAKPYSTANGNYLGIPYTEVVNNYEYLTFETSYLNPRIDKVFEMLLDEISPDVIHIQHLVLLSMNLISIAKKRGIPLVLTFHEYWYQCPANGQRLRPDHSLCHTIDQKLCADCLISSPYLFRGPSKLQRVQTAYWAWTRRLFPCVFGAEKYPALEQIKKRTACMKEALSRVDCFVAPSRFLKDEYVRWGIPEDRIVYSDYGFLKEGFKRLQKRVSDKIRFAFIGSIMPHKGVHLLLEAFEGVPPAKASLTVYGNPKVNPHYSKLLLARASKTQIQFRGEWNTHEIERAYEEIDVLIVPSIWFENSPLTIHEAMMAGVPVITSDLGGMAELIRDGENGFLFQPGSASDLRRCVLEIIENPALLARAGGSCDDVKSIEQNALEMENLYEKLLAHERR